MIEVKHVCDYSDGTFRCAKDATTRIYAEFSRSPERQIDACDEHKKELLWILADNAPRHNPLKVWTGPAKIAGASEEVANA